MQALRLVVAFRGSVSWLSNRLPTVCGLAFERRVSLSGLAVAWLKRGANAGRSEIRHARHGPSPMMTKERLMAAVMIGVDPHKGSHAAVAIGAAEEPLGELRVRASAAQAGRLVAWAAGWPERTWAVEGARVLGSLLAQQLVAAGERVLDVQPKLGARVRLLAAGDTSKNDPDDARPGAIAALRSSS